MPSFVLMFFCLKTSKHPLNTTSANDAVIPGQDQGSYFNVSTNAGETKSTSYRPSPSDSWSRPGMTV